MSPDRKLSYPRCRPNGRTVATPFVPVSGEGVDLEESADEASRPRTPLTPAQRTLAQDYIPMARALAKPLKEAWPFDRDELDSSAMLALVEAAQSYDSSYNVPFGTYARHRIWGGLRDAQRRLIALGWRGDRDNAPEIGSITPESEMHGRMINAEYDRSVEEEFEAIDFVETWLRKLPPKHAGACREIYINDRNQNEAAKAVGCSKSRLSYLHRQSLEMLNDSASYKEYLEAKQADFRRR